jgi:hypothetical protein
VLGVTLAADGSEMGCLLGGLLLSPKPLAAPALTLGGAQRPLIEDGRTTHRGSYFVTPTCHETHPPLSGAAPTVKRAAIAVVMAWRRSKPTARVSSLATSMASVGQSRK